jgi:hypothetical protein
MELYKASVHLNTGGGVWGEPGVGAYSICDSMEYVDNRWFEEGGHLNPLSFTGEGGSRDNAKARAEKSSYPQSPTNFSSRLDLQRRRKQYSAGFLPLDQQTFSSNENTPINVLSEGWGEGGKNCVDLRKSGKSEV